MAAWQQGPYRPLTYQSNPCCEMAERLAGGLSPSSQLSRDVHRWTASGARSRTSAESCQQGLILSLRWEPWPHEALTSAGETWQRGSQAHVDATPRNTQSSAVPFVVICHPGENKYNLCSQNSGSWPAERRVTLTLFSLPAVLRAKGAGAGEARGPDSSYGSLGGSRTEGKAELAI